jgi:hypothetical protein
MSGRPASAVCPLCRQPLPEERGEPAASRLCDECRTMVDSIRPGKPGSQPGVDPTVARPGTATPSYTPNARPSGPLGPGYAASGAGGRPPGGDQPGRVQGAVPPGASRPGITPPPPGPSQQPPANPVRPPVGAPVNSQPGVSRPLVAPQNPMNVNPAGRQPAAGRPLVAPQTVANADLATRNQAVVNRPLVAPQNPVQDNPVTNNPVASNRPLVAPQNVPNTNPLTNQPAASAVDAEPPIQQAPQPEVASGFYDDKDETPDGPGAHANSEPIDWPIEMGSYEEPQKRGTGKKWLVAGLGVVLLGVIVVLGYEFRRWRTLLPGFRPAASTTSGAAGHTAAQQPPRPAGGVAAAPNQRPATQSNSPTQQSPAAAAQQNPGSAATHSSPAPATAQQNPVSAAGHSSPAPVAAATPAVQHSEPSTGPALPSSGTISFQISSFPGQAGADELSHKLTGIGIPAYVVAADIPHRGKWFRVRAGRFATMQQAEQAAAEWRQKAARAGISLQQMITCDYQNP